MNCCVKIREIILGHYDESNANFQLGLFESVILIFQEIKYYNFNLENPIKA